ncbi:MAG: bifunctional glycosyltransferase family 2/GtrA family protein [Candidatus Omnitrophica bacterium]|nr:bifunctional glycosyltransferase family 2/GtrA family protein [Candidatus Omnitrophota bacterium]
MATEKRKFSIIIPCYNEERTLEKCVEKVVAIEDDQISLEIIIVNDASVDNSLVVAKRLETQYPQIVAVSQERNQGKGAAVRRGIEIATGEFLAIQDADLEYNPRDLRRLLEPLLEGEADVVFGSRFLTTEYHRVLYFWHSLGNRFLTFLSNMFTDLNLSDMETCYKVFRTELIKQIELKENHFGFEPEIVAKVAQKRCRIFEMGVSYRGRTYEEGKKIGMKDGLRALYCIFHYNAPKAPLPIQFLIYVFIGGLAAVVNLFLFLTFMHLSVSTTIAIIAAYFIAALVNYLLCVSLLFRHKAKWNPVKEALMFFSVVAIIGVFDLVTTKTFLVVGMIPSLSKLLASAFGMILNFLGRKYIVFPEKASGKWEPQNK